MHARTAWRDKGQDKWTCPLSFSKGCSNTHTHISAHLGEEVEQWSNQQKNNQDNKTSEQPRELQEYTKYVQGYDLYVECNTSIVYFSQIDACFSAASKTPVKTDFSQVSDFLFVPQWDPSLYFQITDYVFKPKKLPVAGKFSKRRHIYATCVYPPALSSILVVAKVAELGKQVKKEDTVLEIPWASSSWNETQKVGRLARIELNISTSSSDMHGFYLVGVYRISMFISINHCQRDRHGVTNECYCYRVPSNGRESVKSRQLWPRESEDQEIHGKLVKTPLTTE